MSSSSPVRRRVRKTLAVALAGTWLAACLVACRPKPPESTGTTLPAKAPTAPPPLLADWKEPRAVILFTGDIHGYLEPCGCTEGQSGGFALRGDLLRQLREEKKWPTTALDVGGTLNDSRVTYPQTLIKFSIILKGLNELGYQGLALGKEELLLGAQQLFTEFTNVSSQPGFHVPFLGSNVTIFGSKELGTPSDTRIIEVGGLKIGVAAVTGMSTRSALENAGVLRDPNELQVQDPRTVLPGMLEKLKAEKPDLLVLLSASDMQESQALAKEFPDFNIVVTSESAEDPRPDPVYIDKTLLVQVGKKGKNAAVVGILPDGKLESTVIELKVDRFKDLPEMVDLMREYQERLKADWPALSAQSISDPKTGSFMGAESCKKCHTYAYSVWSNTKHAHAYESLAKGRPSEAEHWISRIYDPECLACHTTGWDPQKALRHASGFTDMQKTPLLAGQQCENCHGAGSKHVAAEEGWKPGAPVTPEQAAEREALRLTLSRAKTDVCLKCHDGDNSPHFDFDKYWPKVNHSGRKN